MKYSNNQSDILFYIFPNVLLGMLLVYFIFPSEALNTSTESILLPSISGRVSIHIPIIIYLILCSYISSDLFLNIRNNKDSINKPHSAATTSLSGFMILALLIHLFIVMLVMLLLFTLSDINFIEENYIGFLITAGTTIGYHFSLRYYSKYYPDKLYRYSAVGILKSVLFGIRGSFIGFISTFAIWKLMDFLFNNLWSQAFGHPLFAQHTFTKYTFYAILFGGIIISACLMKVYKNTKFTR